MDSVSNWQTLPKTPLSRIEHPAVIQYLSGRYFSLVLMNGCKGLNDISEITYPEKYITIHPVV